MQKCTRILSFFALMFLFLFSSSSQAKPDRDKNPHDKNAPLCRAARTGNLVLLRSEIKTGTPVDQRNEVETTPLILASEYPNEAESLQMVKYLLKKGADIHAVNKFKFNSLAASALMKHTVVFNYLLKKAGYSKGDEQTRIDFKNAIVALLSNNKCHEARDLIEIYAENFAEDQLDPYFTFLSFNQRAAIELFGKTCNKCGRILGSLTAVENLESISSSDESSTDESKSSSDTSVKFIGRRVRIDGQHRPDDFILRGCGHIHCKACGVKGKKDACPVKGRQSKYWIQLH